MPRVKRFTVKAIFEAGMAEYDDTVVFLPLKDAQDLFNLPVPCTLWRLCSTIPKTPMPCARACRPRRETACL